ncbi:hypothetical protein M0802_003928 [Mischocyttarus mexicanus]|nr:hypothetical protein M0802_003928 [Mischocyttarus mexicanus]
MVVRVKEHLIDSVSNGIEELVGRNARTLFLNAEVIEIIKKMKFYLLVGFLFVAMMAVMAVPLEEPLIESFSDGIEGRADTFGKIHGGSNWICNAACWSKGKSAGHWEGDVCRCID